MNNINKMIRTLAYLIPILGLVAGLSLSITIPIFMVITLSTVKNDLKINLSDLKLEITFFFLLMISSLWSLSNYYTLISFCKILPICFLSYLCLNNIDIISKTFNLNERYFIITLIICLSLFYIEYTSYGALSNGFRQLFSSKKNAFALHNLDRGCSILSLFSWVAIALFLKNNRYFLSVFTYVIILITLSLSDSLSAYLGFAISGMVFFISRIKTFSTPKLFTSAIIIFSIFFTSAIFNSSSTKLADDFSFLPISAKHRLFIWSYSLDKIQSKPLFGYGHGASRAFEPSEDEFIDYAGLKLDPLPIHPHNNIIQILLENGIIGFIFYLTLIHRYLINWNINFNNTLLERNLRSAGYACFTTFFIISLISFNMWQSWWLCSYLFIAVIIHIVIKQSTNSSRNKINTA